MGKKAKHKSRKKRPDATGPAQDTADVRERGARGRLAAELWITQDAASVAASRPSDSPTPTPHAEASPDQERRRRRHAHADAAETAARLASLSMVLQRQLARADAGEGLTRARLSALAVLVLGGPRRLGELAAAERVRPPTMTRLVHAMEADGLVTRESDAADRRSVVIRATAAGEAQLAAGRSRQLAPLAASIAALDRAEQETLAASARLLDRLLRESGRAAARSSE
jgi:DNA-binding MarR family transcriptional regulator